MEAELALANYRRPRKDVDLHIGINAQDILNDTEQIGRSAINAKVVEWCITRCVVETVYYQTISAIF